MNPMELLEQENMALGTKDAKPSILSKEPPLRHAPGENKDGAEPGEE